MNQKCPSDKSSQNGKRNIRNESKRFKKIHLKVQKLHLSIPIDFSDNISKRKGLIEISIIMNVSNGLIVILLTCTLINLARAISDELMLDQDEDMPSQNQDIISLMENEDDDDETLERKRTKLRNTIPYGKPCDKKKSLECMLYPEIQCINVVATTYICRCDFLHTWNEAKQKCILNVLAPCLVEAQIVPCGDNMECRNDSLGISDEDKFCRCLKGFKMTENDDKIPAFCVPDEDYVEEEEEVYVLSRAHSKTSLSILCIWPLATFLIREWPL